MIHPFSHFPFLLIRFLDRRCCLLFSTALLFTGCSAETKVENRPRIAVPVTIGSVIQKNVPVQIKGIGNVEAYSVVSIKSQVGGELIKVYFQEGQDVKSGDLLFTIDPRPLAAALKQTEANLAKDKALLNQAEANLNKEMAQVAQAEANQARDTAQVQNAREEARRYSFLVEKGYVAREQYDQIRTNAEALEATVQADKAAVESARAAVQASRAALENARASIRGSEAAVENARIQLEYCSLRSPMSGRTGNLNLQQGNIVKANDLPLVTIHQINPIYVSFSVPEQNLSPIKKHMAAERLKVEALIPGEEKRPEGGVLTFVDNAVDQTTGTIRLKGTFENKEKRLWPGQFVEVILTLALQPNALVVPTQAVQTGQEGPYAFVVKPDRTVESRSVVVNRRMNGETVIGQGLRPGEMVVTNGQLRLFPGAKVEIKNEPAAGNQRP